MPIPDGTVDILKIKNGAVTTYKWLRDSWARKKIIALQQAIAAIVIPTRTSQLTNDSGYITQADVPPGSTPSSTTPLMDGTAAVGTETAFARGDHRHPTDTSRQAALSTTQMAAVNSGVTAAKVQAWDGITVPTKTSDLTNDSDFQTGTQVGNAISAEAGLMVPYGYCTTAAATVAKVVTVSPAVTELTTGLTIAVKFQYANTGSNPTLNVNSLGAKAIKRYGTTAAGTSAASNWNSNSIVMLMYDGTYWMLVDFNNTTYSGMSDAEYQAGTGTSNRLITPARLKAAILLHAPVQSVNGATGDVTVTVPTKTSDLTNDSGFITSVPVTSVNTKTGAVTLSASDVGALPSSTVIPTKTSDLTNDSGYITSAPVQSVNGQTGAVSLDASDVGALPDTTVIPTVPTNVSAFNNDAGYLTSAPVTSINGKTGAVSLTASDVGALPSSTAIPSATSDLTNDSGFITASSVPSASSAAPAMDGMASAGASGAWARGDHVHPHDTSKADAATTLAGYGITDAYTKTQVDGMIPTVPTNVSAFNNDVGYITASAVPDASTVTPSMDGTGAAGSSDDYARADHVHPSDTAKQDALSSAQLDAVNSGITGTLVTALGTVHTKTGTTNANGDIQLFSNANTHVIAAWGTYLCLPFVYNNRTWVKCLKVSGTGTTYTPAVETSVTVNYISI